MTSLVLSSCLVLAWPDPPPQEPRPARSRAGRCRRGHRDRHRRRDRQGRAVGGRDPSVQGGKLAGDAGHPRPKASVQHRTSRQRRFPFDGRLPRVPEPSNLISFDFGSGVVIGDRGQILTLFHVVQGARQLNVRAADRQEFDAEIIAADPRSDLAVIVPERERRERIRPGSSRCRSAMRAGCAKGRS